MAFCNAIVDQSHRGAEGRSVNGSKVYRFLTHALTGAPANASEPYVIFVKCGRYYEKLLVDKPFVTLIGEDRDRAVLTFDDAAGTKKPNGTSCGTTGSASITIRAPDFSAKDLTIENAFDYRVNAAKPRDDPTRLASTQAVALKTEQNSDRAAFRHVKLIGFQDTLYADAGRHYFHRCYITGNVDFIFGAGQAVFEDCDIVSRDRGSTTQNGYITAASTPLPVPFGFVFINCRLKKETPSLADGTIALGRPWHPTRHLPDGTRAADPNAVGNVVFKNCWMDSHITAIGWEAMSGRDKNGNAISFRPEDARLFEYGSTGPGVPKSNTRRVLTENEAEKYTIENVLNGWNPQEVRNRRYD